MLSFAKNPDDGIAEGLSSNDYYPFGLNFINIRSRVTHRPVYNPAVSFENFKFNGKELDETGMYDYGARFYMPDIGRWGQQDPLSEITLDPFGYVYNNPLFYNDPTGMEGEEVSSDTGSGGEAGAGGGGDPPVKGASFGGAKYDGGVSNFKVASDGTQSADITGVALTKTSSTPLPVSGSSTLGGGGGRAKSSFSLSNGSSTSTFNPWTAAFATSGVLLADDVTGVGVVDDAAIVAVLAAALTYDAAYRTYVTYTLTGPNGAKYAGRASGFGPAPVIMLNRYANHHMKLLGYGNPVLDASAQGFPRGYSAIRGREQQLIDHYGGVGSPKVGNSIRGVARGNPAGYEFWSLSNSHFGNIAPYTGYTPW